MQSDLTEKHPAPHGTLTGWRGDKDYFRFAEYEGFQPEAVVDVLRGRVAGAVFRGMVPAKSRAELARRFWASPMRRVRGVEAPGYYLGTYHYHRTTAEYLEETERVAAALDDVLDVHDDPLTVFYGGLSRVLADQGVTVRLAEHEGRKACRGLLRSWHAKGAYTLAPHEDLSQCTEPKQADFEIQRVTGYHSVSLNICLENGQGGRLAFWNIQPDLASKSRLGLRYTGSPYPVETLDGIEMLWLEVDAGDVYVFNSAHVHAVERAIDQEQRRTTLAGIFGLIDDKTLVSWT